MALLKIIANEGWVEMALNDSAYDVDLVKSIAVDLCEQVNEFLLSANEGATM